MVVHSFPFPSFEREENLKKNDMYLIAALLVIAAAVCLFRWQGKETGKEVQVTIDGETYGTYSLMENQTLSLGENNEMEILDGKVSMKRAECPDQLCVQQGWTDIQGEKIICLPNRVIIEVTKGEAAEAEVDAIAN